MSEQYYEMDFEYDYDKKNNLDKPAYQRDIKKYKLNEHIKLIVVNNEKITKKVEERIIANYKQSKQKIFQQPSLMNLLNEYANNIELNKEIKNKYDYKNNDNEYNYYEDEDFKNDAASEFLKNYDNNMIFHQLNKEHNERKKIKRIIINKKYIESDSFEKFNYTSIDSYYKNLINMINNKFNDNYNINEIEISPKTLFVPISILAQKKQENCKLFCLLELYNNIEEIKNTQNNILIQETQKTINEKLNDANFILENVKNLDFYNLLQLKEIIFNNDNYLKNINKEEFMIKLVEQRPDLIKDLDYEYFLNNQFVENLLQNKNCKLKDFPNFIKQNDKFIKIAINSNIDNFYDLPENKQNNPELIKIVEKIKTENKDFNISPTMKEILNKIKQSKDDFIKIG